MGEDTVTSRRTLFLVAIALVAAPILAGCAENDNGANTNPTGGTPATSTPATSTPATTPGTIPNPTTMTLKLGLMMPLSGPLSFLGGDMRDGALLAISEINDANLGLRIEHFLEDDKTVDSAAAPSTFQRLVGRGATAVVGPCCSGVTLAVLETAVDSQVVVASPSATGPGLTARDNDGYFWRVSPSDALQGRVLAKLVDEDNVNKVSIIAINNAYGTGLANVFQTAFTATSGNTVATYQRFNENAEEFSSVVTAACNQNPEAVVIVAYIAQGGNILKEMNEQGCLSRVKVYGSEGIYDGDGRKGIAESAGTGADGKSLAIGVKGTKPDSGNLSAFNEKFRAKYGHAPSQYSAESYDGVMYIALAALSAKSVEGEDIREHLLKISNGGAKMSDYRLAAAALVAGQDIDWQGQAHDFEFTEDHEPAKGIYAIWEVNADGEVETVDTGRIAEG